MADEANNNEEKQLLGEVPTSGLDQYEVQELINYIMGLSSTPPAALDKMMTNLYQKIQMSLGYSVASNVQRQARITKFLSMAEKEVFEMSEEDISNMDREALTKLYNSASKALGEMNEFERRFLAQNKEVFNGKLTEQEKIAQQLMALPQDKIEQIMSIIKGETKEETQQAEEILEDL